MRSTRSFSDLYGLDVCILAGCPLGAELTAAMPEWRMGERDVHAMKYENENPNTTFQCSALDFVCT